MTSNVKYFRNCRFTINKRNARKDKSSVIVKQKTNQDNEERTFLIIITRKGSLMPNVFLGSAGH
jgi:hypothetical protein